MKVLIFLLVLVSPWASANFDNDIKALRDQQRVIERQIQHQLDDLHHEVLPDIPQEILHLTNKLHGQAQHRSLESFLDKAKEHPELVAEFKKSRNTEGKIIVFASLSMPEAELKSLFQHAAVKENVFIHFRGIRPGDTIRSFYQEVAELVKGIEPPPNILLDPVIFKDFQVSKVPVIARKAAGNTYSHILHGSINTDYFEELIREKPGQRDFEAVGHVYDILEPDLIDVMKARAAEIDWEEKKQQAVKRYWKRAQFVDPLPTAQQNRTFLWDPSLVLTEDVVAPDGQIIAPKGTTISPFELGGFSRRVFVFDPTSKAQLEKVLELSRVKQQGLQDVFLLTRTDREKGWEFLQEIERAIGTNVFLIDQNAVQRLRIGNIPVVIVPEGRKLRSTEYAVEAN